MVQLLAVLRDGKLVGQEDARLAGREHSVEDRAFRHVVEGLRGEKHGGVVLSKRLEPFLDLFGEHGVLEEHPAFVEDDEGRSLCAFRSVLHDIFDTVEDIHERRADDAAGVHQGFHLERLPTRDGEMIFVAVENLAVFALVAAVVGERARIEGFFQRAVLQETDEGRDGAVLRLHAGDGRKRIAHDGLLVGRRLDTFFSEEVTEPVKRPLPLVLVVDAREWLERKRFRFADVVELAACAHREDFGTRPLVEDDDTSVLVLSKLRLDGVEADGLARARRTDHEAVADVLDVQVETEGTRSFRLRVKKRRRIEMLVPRAAAPRERERHHVDEIARREHRLTHVARLARDAREPCIDGVEVFDLRRLDAALDEDLPDEFCLFLDGFTVFVHDEHRRRVVDEGDVIAFHGVHRVADFGEAVDGHVVDVVYVLLAAAHGGVGDGRGQGLRLAFELSALARKLVRDVGLAHRDGSRHPAYGEVEPVELVEESEGRVRAVGDGCDDAQVFVTELRLKTAIKRRIVHVLVDEKRDARVFHRPIVDGDGGMKVGHEAVLVEEFHFDAEVLHHFREFVEHFAKVLKYIVGFRDFLLSAFNDEFLELFLSVFRRHVPERRKEARLEVGAARKERCTLCIHAARDEIGKILGRLVGRRRQTLRLEIQDVVRAQRADFRFLKKFFVSVADRRESAVFQWKRRLLSPFLCLTRQADA